MYFDDFVLNYAFEIPPAEIDKDEMIEFARRYDNIPLHTDEEYASKTRFKKLIAPGVMSFMAVWAKYLEVDLFGDELIAGKSTKIEWEKPVFAGDILKGRAVVSSLLKRNERNGIVELSIDVYNQHGERVLTNVTEAVVKCRETVQKV